MVDFIVEIWKWKLYNCKQLEFVRYSKALGAEMWKLKGFWVKSIKTLRFLKRCKTKNYEIVKEKFKFVKL
jgi:hypothetical protein